MARSLMTSKQVARRLGCSSRSVQRIVKRGILPTVGIFGARRLRFKPESVQALIDRMEGAYTDESAEQVVR